MVVSWRAATVRCVVSRRLEPTTMKTMKAYDYVNNKALP